MKHPMNSFFRFSVLALAFMATGLADAVTPQNPRAATSTNVAPARAAGRDVKRNESDTVTRSTVARSAATSRTAVSARTGTTSAARNTRNAATISRNATVARSARTGTVPARSATTTNKSNVSRAASSRATAIFNDINKIGGGYAQCREAYATCMDQFCSKANDSYRRCFCSNRFTEFRDTENALDQAKVLLQQFEDNNLNAVDKTVAEVEAMYSATIGEAAIKEDTSGAQKLLNQISDLLAGKKSAEQSPVSSTSLTGDYSVDGEDIWNASETSSAFSGDAGVSATSLEGDLLYNYVHKQCSEIVAESCQNNAVSNMAKSAYGIMITQDCNVYEKSIDTKRQQVQNVVRQAEKYLREARLEDYRAHNTQDVNECLDKVRTAIQADTACGANYSRCLDYTGAYIKTDGTPYFSPRFFELANLIKLDSVSDNATDVLIQNPQFNNFLDSRKNFATAALDTCRDKADWVWDEFKRAALIEIAQAQDDKIEEVKSSCISTMKECYDTQSQSLKDFDDTTAVAAGAIGAAAARQMCQDQVIACASLYGDTNGCAFDGNGRLTAGNKGNRCGLDALLSFVDTVDSVRVAEGCDTALTNFAKELCTTTDGLYPNNCLPLSQTDLKNQILTRASLYCFNIDGTKYTSAQYTANKTDDQVTAKINRLIDGLQSDITRTMADKCTELGGIWGYAGEHQNSVTNNAQKYAETQNIPYMDKFYSNLFGGNTNKGTDYGVCIQNTVEMQCSTQDSITGGHGYAKYNKTTNKCEFTQQWYENRCNAIGGYWENNICHVAE